MSADLRTLRGARLRSLTIRDRSIAGGLDVLPADLPLRELAVDNRPPDRDLRGVQQWQDLEYVSCFGTPVNEIPADEPAVALDILSQLPATIEVYVDGQPLALIQGI